MPSAIRRQRERKLRDLYDAFTDVAAIEAAGLGHAQADLDKLAGLNSLDDVATAMGTIPPLLDGPFGIYFGVDDKHPDRYSVNLYQSGLGLPDRDYYLRDDKEIADTRAAYRKYLSQMLAFTGAKGRRCARRSGVQLEHDLALVSWPAADRRDADKTYNPMTVSELAKLAPAFPWRAFLSAAGVAVASPRGERGVIVAEKSAFPGLAAVFAATPVSVWRDYLVTRYLHGFASVLPKKFDDADFAFYGVVLQGKTAQLDRATRGVHLLDTQMGEALGKLYAARHFPPAAKAKADALVHNLLRPMPEDIRRSTGMTPATREKALEKLSRYMLKVGYPTDGATIRPLAISARDPVANAKATTAFEWNRELTRIDAPVDRTEWGMSVPTNNAYYNPPLNEIVFPAGILQPPFFDADADGRGELRRDRRTIGHEISHGFDDQGSKYDGNGVLESWWTEEDRKNFDARHRGACRAIRFLRAAARPAHQRPAHAR